ncbi:unnamed protein product [Paramecium primaurelia]|uniref:Uncharacterized protein n=2 Tax=Paramecium TaxID=5884 RepID=A0A8S1XUL1_9CILI|nr:unnamed protein product [Paramecium primaurelia]CAD8205049.1 unnamed protein product [Paramecium pentaurelia]
MDFLGIKNNKFVKNKELCKQQEELCMKDDYQLQLDNDTHIIVPESPNFKFIQTIKRKRNR